MGNGILSLSRLALAVVAAVGLLGHAAAEPAFPAPTRLSPAPQGGATFEPGVARIGGAYNEFPASTPEACAAACAEDGLCISWSYAREPAPACALNAVAPHPREDVRAVSGLSARAPAFVRLTFSRPPGPPTPLATPLASLSEPAVPAPDPPQMEGALAMSEPAPDAHTRSRGMNWGASQLPQSPLAGDGLASEPAPPATAPIPAADAAPRPRPTADADPAPILLGGTREALPLRTRGR